MPVAVKQRQTRRCLATPVSDQEFQAVGPLAKVHERVPGLLHRPGGGRVGTAERRSGKEDGRSRELILTEPGPAAGPLIGPGAGIPAQVQDDTVYGISMLSRRSPPRPPARRAPPSQRLAARWPSSSMSRQAELGRSSLWRGRTYRA